MGRDITLGTTGAIEWYNAFSSIPIVQNSLNTAETLTIRVKEVASTIFGAITKFVSKTTLDPFIASLNSSCTDIEKGFNLVCSLPFISHTAGLVRVIVGKIQVVVGMVFAGISQFYLLLNFPNNTLDPLNPKWQTLTKLGTEFIIHGCLNVLRGSGEALLGEAFMGGIGSLALLVPNLSYNRNFDPYFTYGTLLAHESELPPFHHEDHRHVEINITHIEHLDDAVAVDNKKDPS